MNEDASPIELLFKRAEDYSKTTLALIHLNTIDKLADVVSTIVSRLVIYVLATISMLIINIGLALWIGQLMGAAFYGFLIVGFFYAFMAMVLSLFKDVWIKKPLNNSIIEHLLKIKKS